MKDKRQKEPILLTDLIEPQVLNKEEFMQQYVLNRATCQSMLDGLAAAKEADIAFKHIKSKVDG